MTCPAHAHGLVNSLKEVERKMCLMQAIVLKLTQCRILTLTHCNEFYNFSHVNSKNFQLKNYGSGCHYYLYKHLTCLHFNKARNKIAYEPRLPIATKLESLVSFDGFNYCIRSRKRQERKLFKQ